MTIKTIFLDRDGVINLDKNYVHRIDDFEFIKGIFKSCNHFSKLGYEIIIVTNQSGISRGYYSFKEYEILTNWMLDQFKTKQIKILDVFHCPHSPDDKCICRKPLPGMLLAAKDKYDIDMTNSWLIGDREDDISAANSSGISNTILVDSFHETNFDKSNAKYFLKSIHDSIKIISN